jgi:hypothetical protein
MQPLAVKSGEVLEDTKQRKRNVDRMWTNEMNEQMAEKTLLQQDTTNLTKQLEELRTEVDNVAKVTTDLIIRHNQNQVSEQVSEVNKA